MNGDCTHTNVTGLFLTSGTATGIDGAMTVPNDPSHLGLQIALQAVGNDRRGALRLGQATQFVVAP